jgi:hypothetical protein
VADRPLRTRCQALEDLVAVLKGTAGFYWALWQEVRVSLQARERIVVGALRRQASMINTQGLAIFMGDGHARA